MLLLMVRMPCCKCNRTGSCRRCACVKAGRSCTSCLPTNLGTCLNPSIVPKAQNATEYTISNPQTSLALQLTSTDHDPDEPEVDALPPYKPIPEPNFRWDSEEDGKTITCTLNRIYDKIVHWRRNLFKVPSGKHGKSFVRELTRMFNAYAEGSLLEIIAVMTMPALLLQKPSSKSKAKEHTSHLERRLKLWTEGKLDDLLHEGDTIQQKLIYHQSSRHKGEDQTARIFSKLMMEGKVRAALRLITQTGSTGPLPLDSLANDKDPTSTKTVREVLVEKHPSKQPPKKASIAKPDNPVDNPHPIIII